MKKKIVSLFCSLAIVLTLTTLVQGRERVILPAPAATISLNNSASISWGAVPGADSYTIFAFNSREAAELGDITQAARVYEGATSGFAIRARFENRGIDLVPGTQYWLRVQASAEEGLVSELSQVVGAYVVPTRPGSVARQLMADNAGSYIIIDTRNATAGEFLGGHLQGALLINSPSVAAPPLAGANLAARAPYELPNKDALILIYCQGANRSAQAAHALANMGYTNVHDIGAWTTDLTEANGFTRVRPVGMPAVTQEDNMITWNPVANADSYTVFAVNRNLHLHNNNQTNNPHRSDIAASITTTGHELDLTAFAPYLLHGNFYFHVQANTSAAGYSPSVFSYRLISFYTEAFLLEANPAAVVVQTPGNTNELNLTLELVSSDGTIELLEDSFTIRNNADGTFTLGDFEIFVSTRGNTQIRDIQVIK